MPTIDNCFFGQFLFHFVDRDVCSPRSRRVETLTALMRGGRLSLKAQSLLPSDPYVDEEPSASAVATSSGTRSAIACGVLGFVGGVVLTAYALHRKNAPRDDVAPTPPSPTHARLYDTLSPVMDTPEFVVAGRSLLEYIAHYRTAIVPGGASAPAAGPQPVRSAVKPGFLTNAAALASMPEEGADWPTIMKEFEALIAPGLTHWESPNFYAYFKPHSSYPSVLGEMLSAGLNVMGFSWNASPACTELESVTLDWLAQLIDLPAAFHCGSGGKAGDASGDGRGGKGGGVIQGSAGESCIVAMLAARARATALWKTAPHVAARNAERVPTLVAYARSVLRRAHVVFHLTTPCLQLSHIVSPFVPPPPLQRPRALHCRQSMPRPRQRSCAPPQASDEHRRWLRTVPLCAAHCYRGGYCGRQLAVLCICNSCDNVDVCVRSAPRDCCARRRIGPPQSAMAAPRCRVRVALVCSSLLCLSQRRSSLVLLVSHPSLPSARAHFLSPRIAAGTAARTQCAPSSGPRCLMGLS